MTSSLQIGLVQADNALLFQVVGSSPSLNGGCREGDRPSACCVSLANEFDMSTVRLSYRSPVTTFVT